MKKKNKRNNYFMPDGGSGVERFNNAFSSGEFGMAEAFNEDSYYDAPEDDERFQNSVEYCEDALDEQTSILIKYFKSKNIRYEISNDEIDYYKDKYDFTYEQSRRIDYSLDENDEDLLFDDECNIEYVYDVNFEFADSDKLHKAIILTISVHDNTYNESLSLKEGFADNVYMISANDFISNSFSGYEDGKDYDQLLKKCNQILRILKTNEKTCIIAVITIDDYDYIPSQHFEIISENKKYNFKVVQLFDDECVEAIDGWNIYIWFRNDKCANRFFKNMEIYNNGEFSNEFSEQLNESALSPKIIADTILSNTLDYDEYTDSLYTEDDNYYVQIQDRKSNSTSFIKDKNGQYRQAFKQPKVSTNSWARVWKDGKLIKSFDGPKFKTRQDLINFLRNE